MMRALYSGVSGLRVQQTKLDVISNNISNVNTIGYKSQSASFSDILSETLSGATGSTSTKGGTNAIQVGLGVSLASIDTLMTTGSTQSTGNSTDLSIGGDGFFIVQGGARDEYQFTRAGNFGVDESGDLTVNGYLVCGWQQYTVDADGNYVYDEQQSVEPINLFADDYNGNKKIMAAQATTGGTLSGNLDPSKTAQGTALDDIDTTDPTVDMTTTMEVYDAQGNSYDIQVNFSKCYVDTSDPNNPVTSWYWEIESSDSNLTAGGSGYLQFDQNGNLITTDQTNFPTTATVTLTPSGTGTAPFTVNLDMSEISTYTSSDSNKITVVTDGYEAGTLQDYTIGTDGVITGVYSNGETQAIGKLALAVFSNPTGLEKLGSGLYVASANSGDFTGGVSAGSAGSGALSSGTLEMSNVDLAQQFSEMMIAQRAYQANSKVISAVDEILQTLVNLIR